MRSQFRSVKPRIALRLSTACALALSVSACSSDAMRFTETPFDSPFKTAQAPAQRDPVTTGSISRVENAPLAAPGRPVAVRSQPLPPPQSAVALRSAPPAAAPVAGSANGWSAQGGTPIVVAQGETLDEISSRYGVPRSALIAANGLSGAGVAPGQRLTIPVYSGGGASAPRQMVRNEAPAAEAPRLSAPTPRPAAPVAEVKSKAQIAAEAKARAAEEQAQAKARAAADAEAMRESRAKFAAEAKAKAEAKKLAIAKPATEPKAVPEARPAVAETKKPAPAPVPEKVKPTVVASAPPEQKVTAVPKAASAPAAAPAPEPVTTASLPKPEDAAPSADFRWPARGRVIAGYGGKGGNEGINIAVPEGTPVKAAEGGVVAYAGSELKGYGNLVLIRHPNGYVSAYAHNGDLGVKRGETVKRGQVIAKSGQTGNVASPQLHFELRKGSTPVDPMPYLNN